MPDSPRWCATHGTYGDHHTDRCPLTFDDSPEAAQARLVASVRKGMGLPERPSPRPRRGLWARLIRRS